jgi:glycosyltransferase involved in cell wall biosynthesis
VDREAFEMAFALPRDSPFYDKLAAEGFTVYGLTISRNPFNLRNVSALCAIWKLVRSGRYDIVHTHTSVGGFLGRIIARINRVPLILWTIHGWSFDYPMGTALRRPFFWTIEKFLDRFTDHYVAISNNMQEVGIKAGISARDKVTVIYHGIETADAPITGARPASRAGSTHPVVGTVGRLEPQKGVDDFLKAASMVKQRFPRARFVVVGDGPLRKELERLSTTLGMEGDVVFAGWQENVAAHLARMDIFCLSSRWEGFGIILLEAMAANVPIVATRVGGVPEIIVEGKGGILVSPGQPAEMADALCRLLADADMRERMGAFNSERVRTVFDVERMTAEYEGIYRKVARR